MRYYRTNLLWSLLIAIMFCSLALAQQTPDNNLPSDPATPPTKADKKVIKEKDLKKKRSNKDTTNENEPVDGSKAPNVKKTNSSKAPVAEKAAHPLIEQIDLAISLNQLIDPPGQCAWDLYQILTVSAPNEPNLKDVTSRVITALSGPAKTPLELYAQGVNRTFTRIEWANAQQFSSRLVSLEPKDKNLVVLDLFYKGMVALGDKDPEKAEDLFRQGLKKDDKAAYLYNAMGRALSDQHKDEEALKAYLKASKLEPQWNYPLVNIAIKYLRKGDLEQAQRYALNALNINVSDIEAHAILGQVSASVGNYDDAVREYSLVVTQRQNSVPDLITYGRLLLEQGNYPVAESILATAVQLNFNDARAKLYLSIAAEKHAQAVFNDSLDKLKQSTSQDWATLVTLGDAAMARSNKPAALEAYQAALKLEPWHVDVRLRVAKLLGEANNFVDAIAEYRNVIKVNNNVKEAHNGLGEALKKSGNLKEAITEYRKALEIEDRFILARTNLADALRDMGDLTAAAAEYKNILNVEPNNQAIITALKDIEAKQAENQKSVN